MKTIDFCIAGAMFRAFPMMVQEDNVQKQNSLTFPWLFFRISNYFMTTIKFILNLSLKDKFKPLIIKISNKQNNTHSSILLLTK